ncbi:MAG: HgcAB-associated protein [Dehalococcoidia bacterium]|jgi:AbrB family looped-hinge helix DNA binding protein
MANKKQKDDSCCSSPDDLVDRFQVEAIVSVDERGQMVLPKEVREKVGIRAGDKLAIISRKKPGSACCMFLFKADDMADMVKSMLGPLLSEINKK